MEYIFIYLSISKSGIGIKKSYDTHQLLSWYFKNTKLFLVIPCDTDKYIDVKISQFHAAQANAAVVNPYVIERSWRISTG